MSRIKLELTGTDVEKLGVMIHENVDNEITLCGENIHGAVTKVERKCNGTRYANTTFPSRQLEYGRGERYILWLDASKLDLNKFAELL